MTQPPLNWVAMVACHPLNTLNNQEPFFYSSHNFMAIAMLEPLALRTSVVASAPLEATQSPAT